MRDFIKSKEYFDIFIAEEKDRVEKFEAKIKSGTLKEDRVLPVKDKLLLMKLGIIIAKYSRGDSIPELKNEFESIIDLFVEACNLESYDDNLKFASLAYLFDVNDVLRDRIKIKLSQSPNYDYIIDFILLGNKASYAGKSMAFPYEYSKLLKAIESEEINLISEYISEWYNKHKHNSWYNSHKSSVNIYYGYWCFEAVAVANRLNLDCELLKNKKYFPYDLGLYRIDSKETKVNI